LITGVQLGFSGHEEAFIKVGGRHEPNRSLNLNPHAQIVKLIECCIGMIDWEYPKLSL